MGNCSSENLVAKERTARKMMRLLQETAVQFASMSALAAWILRRVERDYEEKGQLSRGASALAWVLYLSQVGLTVSAALRPSKRLPVNRKMAAVLASSQQIPAYSLPAYGSFAPSSRCQGSKQANWSRVAPTATVETRRLLGGGLCCSAPR